MKKLSLFLVLSISVFPVLAYTQTDIDNAIFLANENIIVKQSSTAGYRLDATITRAEVMGIALKMKGIVLPNYQCKGYFTDVRSNGWICRAVELAADNGIISRANTKARPQDVITRAEALAIIANSFGINTAFTGTEEHSDNHSVDLDEQPWQADLFSIITSLKIDIPDVKYFTDTKTGMYNLSWKPNNFATRKYVFDFAGKLLRNENISNQEIRIENNNVVLYKNGIKIKNITTDGNSIYGDTCIHPAEMNHYSLVGKAGDFYIISHAVGLCETDAGHTDMLIFDGISLVNLVTKIKQKFDIQLGYGVGASVEVKNNQMRIFGEFSYSSDCVDLGCPVYISRDKISSLGVHVIKEPSGSTPGEFEFFFDPSILF